ncbi:dihydrofolate reductase family protein [Corynebacterium sp. LK2510]|uniref:dihydrofolate reductase family protein n=1 Tax=Corynebacterium sp. LK2510 TaxID=3110472 RepID=UPI0034CED53D
MDVSHIIGTSSDTHELRAVMATTLLGSFTRGGTSGPLGNTNDAALLAGLRAWSDCVLVAAGTVRAENYGYSDTPMSIVSTSLDVDAGSELFHGHVLVLCPEASLYDASLAPRRATLINAGAQLISTGRGSAEEILNALHEHGYAHISCEGGPSLYSSLLQADLVDVLHLTIDPSVSDADGHGGLNFEGDRPFLHRFQLEAVESDAESMLFCRYRRARP